MAIVNRYFDCFYQNNHFFVVFDLKHTESASPPPCRGVESLAGVTQIGHFNGDFLLRELHATEGISRQQFVWSRIIRRNHLLRFLLPHFLTAAQGPLRSDTQGLPLLPPSL